MNINNLNIELNEKEITCLKRFFNQNVELFKESDFTDYKNIEVITILYEHYLNENNLKNSDALMLFLAELKANLLAYKIAKAKKNTNLSKNTVIEKWYNECFTDESVKIK